MAKAGILKKLREAVLADFVLPLVVTSLGAAAAATGASVIALQRRFDWVSGPAQALIAFGVFMFVLAIVLSLLPRWWRPSGPFGRVFGTAAFMVGFSEDRNRQVFMQMPALREECARVAKQLYEFVDAERPKIPTRPRGVDDGTPELDAFNLNVAAGLRRFTSLYHNSWRRKVEPLFVDARAMGFGPVPSWDPYLDGRTLTPDDVYRLAVALDRLSQVIPRVFSEPLYEAHVGRLAALKRDGITLAVDLGEFLVERRAAFSVLMAQDADENQASSLERHMAQMDRSRTFDEETEALLLARFGGQILDVVSRLKQCGMLEEELSRVSYARFGLGLSAHDIGPLAASISASCQRIRFE